MAVVLNGLSAGYSSDFDEQILSDVDVRVQQGSFYVIVGASGAGKSTLVKTITGQMRHYTARHASVFGKPIGSQSRSIGYMPQVAGLMDDLTVMETLHVYGKLYGMHSDDINLRIKFLLDQMDMAPYAKQLLRTLSGGQKQRASLMVALMHCPPLLILDEPMSGLDPSLREKQTSYLHRVVANHGVTVVLVTQFFDLAATATHVALMHEGRLLTEAAPRDVIAQWDEPQSSDTSLQLTVTDQLQNACSRLCLHFNGLKSKTEYRKQLQNDVPSRDSASESSTRAPRADQQPRDQDEETTGAVVVETADVIPEWPEIDMPQSSSIELKISRIHSIVESHSLASYRLSNWIFLILVFIQPLLEIYVYNTFLFRDIPGKVVGVSSLDHGVMVDDEPVFYSRSFLDTFEGLNDYKLRHFDSRLESKAAVSRTEMLLAIHIKKDFSSNIVSANASNSIPSFDVFTDANEFMSSQQMINDLYEAWYTQVIQHGTGGLRRVSAFSTAITGDLGTKYHEVFCAGIIGVSLLMNGLVIGIAETSRRYEEGTAARMLLCSATATEYFIGNVIGFATIYVPQIITVCVSLSLYTSDSYTFTAETVVSLGFVLLMSIPTSLTTAVAVGLMSGSQTRAQFLTFGTYIAMMVLAGSFWPLESQAYPLRALSVCMPSTWVSASWVSALLDPHTTQNMLVGVVMTSALWITMSSVYCIRKLSLLVRGSGIHREL